MVERKVGDLWVDPEVQRSLNKHRVGLMVPEFDANAIGVLTTSYRSARRIHVVDGQHRYRLMEAVKYSGTFMTMEYHDLTLQDEAALFRKLNTTRKPSRVDHFLVACIEQDPAVLHMRDILDGNGWQISPYGGEGRLTAVAALERVYALDADAMKRTMHVITHAWGHQGDAVQASLLLGIGRVMFRHGAEMDLDDLVVRLGKFPGGPNGLIGNARGQKATSTGDLSTQVARIVVALYNQRRRSTQVPRWE
jgi:hypothetical protein